MFLFNPKPYLRRLPSIFPYLGNCIIFLHVELSLIKHGTSRGNTISNGRINKPNFPIIVYIMIHKLSIRHVWGDEAKTRNWLISFKLSTAPNFEIHLIFLLRVHPPWNVYMGGGGAETFLLSALLFCPATRRMRNQRYIQAAATTTKTFCLICSLRVPITGSR